MSGRGSRAKEHTHLLVLLKPPQETHAFALKVKGLVQEAQRLGEGEAQIGPFAGDLIADGLSQACPPISQLQFHRRQAIGEADEIGDPAVQGNLVVYLHPPLAQKEGGGGTKVFLLHDAGRREGGS